MVAHRLPGFFTVLHFASAAYLLWLAWRIANSTGPGGGKVRGRPLSLFDAAAFQWVNPKAWAMVLGAVASFARPDHIALDVPLIALVLVVAGMPCIALRAGSGSALRRFLEDPRALKAFNLTMAALLVLSIAPGLWEEFVRLR